LWARAMMALIALALVPEWPAVFSGGRGNRLAAGVVFAAVLAAGYFTNVLIIRANMVYKVAAPLDRRAEWDVVIPLYDQAIKLAPLEDQYYLFIGRAYLEASARVTEQADQESLINAAANELKIAYQINPLNPDHSANLARLYQRWARSVSDPAQAGGHIAESNRYYEQALILSPNTPSLWIEWGRLGYTLDGDDAGALNKLETALKLDEEFNETYIALGDYWSRAGQGESDAADARADYEKALGYYQLAIAAEIAKPEAPKSLTARLGLAGAHKALGKWNEAITAYGEVIALAGTDTNLWAVYDALAESYLEIGDKAAALEAAQKALAAAVNAEDKATVQKLIDLVNQP
ncbi:MAG: tetratricopeptide repeat protein, partial [Chloroflexota bacterium]